MKENTKNGFAYADQRNFYGDFPTAYIDAIYHHGQFYDRENGQVVTLREEASVRLIVQRMDIPEADREKYYSTTRKVLDREVELRFELPSRRLTFFVRLLGDLYFEKKGNKPARALDVACEIYDKPTQYGQQCLPLFAADSLNQAYFQASVRHRPEARSHVTNIYQKFYIDGTDRTLESLRF
jgi:hypothetical protein